MRQAGGRGGGRARLKNLAQCVRLFVMGSQTHFNFICDALRTNTQTEGQTDKQSEVGGEAAMAERINHKLMRCECRSFWQRQLSVASSRQLPVLASLPRFCLVPFGSVRFGSFRLFALLVQTKQISLTLGCLACKCHFSVQITQFITFHLTRRVESNSQRVQRVPFSPLSLSPSILFRSHSAPVRTANVFPIRLSGQIGSGSF